LKNRKRHEKLKHFQILIENMRSFNDIQTFIDVASCASISEDARQNAQTPAAVSAAIKRLEKDLGNVLFLRSTRSLRLSVAGCCGQLIPDSKLSFSSAIAGATIWLWLCGLRQL
jgi:hypothetical protein